MCLSLIHLYHDCSFRTLLIGSKSAALDHDSIGCVVILKILKKYKQSTQYICMNISYKNCFYMFTKYLVKRESADKLQYV